MAVRELHPLFRQAINVGSRDLTPLRIVALHIPVTEVIGIEDDDVGLCRSRDAESPSEQQDGEEKESRFHDRSNRFHTTDRTNFCLRQQLLGDLRMIQGFEPIMTNEVGIDEKMKLTYQSK